MPSGWGDLQVPRPTLPRPLQRITRCTTSPGDGCRTRTINGVSYHYCQPQGGNTVQYCEDMSNQMVEQFNQSDKKEKFDILHFHDWHPIPALHRLQDRDTILTFHSTEYGRNGNQFGDWWEYREISGQGMVRRPDRKEGDCCFHGHEKRGHAALQCARLEMRCRPERHCAAPVPGPHRCRGGEAGIRDPPVAPLILFIGGWSTRKARTCSSKHSRKVCRERWDAKVIVAGDGGMRQYLQERARDLPVNFVGYIPDSEYIRLLNACDLVVIPSRNEPFGLVLLEAWSAEKPVVACDVGGLSENISHGIDGLKVGVSPDGLAWGIQQIVDDPENGIRFGLRGRRKVDSVFQWEPIANTLVDTYRKIAA